MDLWHYFWLGLAVVAFALAVDAWRSIIRPWLSRQLEIDPHD